jgi:hypothetical protein
VPRSRYCVVAGHSHIAAFGVPISSPDRAPTLSELAHPSGRFRIMTGEWPRTESYWGEVCKAAAGNVVALFWLGNQPLARYLLEPDERFDFVLSSEPELWLDDTATIVPEAMVRASFQPTLRGLAHLLRLLHVAGAHTVVCGTPPPCGNDEWIINYLVNNPRWHRFRHTRHDDAPSAQGHFWVEALPSDAAVDPGTIRLTPRVLRYKLWAVLQTLVSETAAAAGAQFVASPRTAQTDDGFLAEDYRFDITHANGAYGALVLDGLWPRVQALDAPA